jgi:hypothetical protein
MPTLLEAFDMGRAWARHLDRYALSGYVANPFAEIPVLRDWWYAGYAS